ncbi:hypothetical protein CMV30_18255 [Nibricoccus aquaticus]|uniref:Uncharacterized protein n=1 Tax=Nibricoccus aquaticus TaxID=2576891 RepID=A0A290QBB1_9BACT|nr:hypothetical protein CMV30_18255 [Nibricoccus aquaticus]
MLPGDQAAQLPQRFVHHINEHCRLSQCAAHRLQPQTPRPLALQVSPPFVEDAKNALSHDPIMPQLMQTRSAHLA